MSSLISAISTRAAASQAGHRRQQIDGGTKGGEHLAQMALQRLHGGVERLDLRQMQLEHEAMMRGHPAMQHLDQLRAAGLQAAGCEIGQALGVGLARDERVEDRPAAVAQNVTDDLSVYPLGSVVKDLRRMYFPTRPFLTI